MADVLVLLLTIVRVAIGSSVDALSLLMHGNCHVITVLPVFFFLFLVPLPLLSTLVLMWACHC